MAKTWDTSLSRWEGGGGGSKTQKHTSEPVGGFHPNMISSKLLGIILLEKDPKFFVCSGGGGGGGSSLHKGEGSLMYWEIA